MKKIISLALIFILSVSLICLFASCGEDSEVNAPSGIVSNIADYIIIRSVEASQTVKNAASELQSSLAKKLDVKLSASTDSKDESKYEIILGNTTREISDSSSDALALGEFKISKTGDKIVIAGGSDKAIGMGVKFFCQNFITDKGVRIPADGYSYTDRNAYTSIKIEDTDIADYTIIRNLYNAASAEEFAKTIENLTYSSLPIVSYENIENVSGKYILLDDTNIDFSSYEITVKDGNITLYANYDSIDDCINSFLLDFLGYDSAENTDVSSKEVVIENGDNRSYTVEKSKIYSKDTLLSVLEEVYNADDKIIVGQQMSERLGETMTTERKLYKDNCGVESPLYGYDVGVMASNQKSTVNGRIKDAYDMIEYMREGGIITISAHLENPTGDGRATDQDPHRGELGHEAKWDEVMTEGTELNAKLMEILDEVADFLEIFHVNDATVIFRPFHEMNGNWFWYCIKNSENGIEKTLPKDYAVKLWKYLYNYITVEREIDNMIWEYSPNVARRSDPADVMYCYPGDDYCDIVGADWYTSEYTGHELIAIADEDMAKPTGKIFSIAEFGPGESIRTDFSKSETYKFTCTHLDDFITEVTDAGINTCYWMLWSSWGDVKISMWNMGDANLFYDNDIYLTLEDTAKMLYK